MTTTDVARLYDLLEAARGEAREAHRELKDEVIAAHHELKNEVVGYRADLNGRLKVLEVADAHHAGISVGRGNVGRITVGAAAVAASIGAVVGAIVAVI